MTICCWNDNKAEEIMEYLKDKVFKHKYKKDLNLNEISTVASVMCLLTEVRNAIDNNTISEPWKCIGHYESCGNVHVE